MTLTADWQVEVGALVLGAGTAYEIDDAAGGIGGLGLAGIRSYDAPRGDRDGEVAVDDVYEARLLTIPVVAVGDGPAAASALVTELRAAWAAQAGEVTLDLRLPGQPETALRFYGRPRGLQEDQRLLRSGVVRALATFRALDPLRYGAAVTTAALTPGTTPVVNAGDASTERVTITLVGSGGTPSITNAADDSGAIAWAAPLANGVTRTIDLRARTVVSGGTDRYGEVAPSSRWFRLRAGSNPITVAGCTSATLTYRPAWP